MECVNYLFEGALTESSLTSFVPFVALQELEAYFICR